MHHLGISEHIVDYGNMLCARCMCLLCPVSCCSTNAGYVVATVTIHLLHLWIIEFSKPSLFAKDQEVRRAGSWGEKEVSAREYHAECRAAIKHSKRKKK